MLTTCDDSFGYDLMANAVFTVLYSFLSNDRLVWFEFQWHWLARAGEMALDKHFNVDRFTDRLDAILDQFRGLSYSEPSSSSRNVCAT